MTERPDLELIAEQGAGVPPSSRLAEYALSLEARLKEQEEALQSVRRDVRLVIDGSLRSEMSAKVKGRLRRALSADTEAPK